jgi:hypothetical protein
MIIHVIYMNKLSINRDAVVAVALNSFIKLTNCSEALLAMMPSKSPLRQENRLAYDSLVVLNDRFWRVRVDHDIDLADTTSGDLF